MFKLGFVSFFLAVLCFVCESLWYGDIGEDGVLNESFFLPLGYIFAALGIVLVAVALVRRCLR